MMCKSIAAAAALTFVALCAPGNAGATSVATTGGGSAADVVGQLNAEGYDVRLNGQSEGSLAGCTVTGVHRTSGGDSAVRTPLMTVYVDIDCPGDD